MVAGEAHKWELRNSVAVLTFLAAAVFGVYSLLHRQAGVFRFAITQVTNRQGRTHGISPDGRYVLTVINNKD